MPEGLYSRYTNPNHPIRSSFWMKLTKLVRTSEEIHLQPCFEVLDPEQNSTFSRQLPWAGIWSQQSDVYCDRQLDESSIQGPLMDRMEIIELEGYSLEEKVEIARHHLIPQQLAEHGLKAKQISFSDELLTRIIEDYTQESGVRSLSRLIASLWCVKPQSKSLKTKIPSYASNLKILKVYWVCSVSTMSPTRRIFRKVLR